MGKKVWGGRFSQETDALVNAFNASIGFDRRLYAYDIDGSMAHCRMLAKQGIITDDECSKIQENLGGIKRELDHGDLPFEDEYEDIHSLVEKTLVGQIGALGEKLHTGRSRNDQVALDVRLYVRDAIYRVIGLVKETQRVLVGLAENNLHVIMPGFTHLQRAQPVRLSHHMMAYYEMLKRDRNRFEESLIRVNVLPLGSAALAGSTFDLDRGMVARELGFETVSENSMDAVSDRDFALEFLFNAATVMMHLSRLSEELVIWSSAEFGFVEISDAFCTGSSMMPQKKNPDLPELIRGKTGRVYGNLMGLLTTMKGLPLSYNKDMQEDKEALFDTADTVHICLEVMGRLLGQISFKEERLREAAGKGYLVATDLADYLVVKGSTFRDAHEVVGKMVLFAMDQGKELQELSIKEMKTFYRQVDKDVYQWLNPSISPDRKKGVGGTAQERVEEAVRKAKAELSN